MISNLQLKDILIDQLKGFVYIVLNRPEALNALTLEMTRVISLVVKKVKADKNIKGIFITGEGDRAFCAGGDLKSLYYEGMAYRRGEINENLASIFFEDEYNLNAEIKSLGKIYVSFLNGITMGGGYGISGHGTHIAATAGTKFAMPEVRIGFFPDVGASYHLSRLDGYLGLYLALTGTTIGASDMYYAGLCNAVIDGNAIHRIESKIADELIKNNEADFETQKELVSTLLQKHHIPQETSSLENNIDKINEIFSKDSVEEIVEALRADKSDWAKETLALMEYACPFSMKVSFEQYKRSKSLDFGEVMAQDYILATHFILGHDLYEGIKSTVIAKGRKPLWSPDKLEDVLDKDVTNYFLPVNLL
jgi:enoyl-CoA hydratase/carnithine racemase